MSAVERRQQSEWWREYRTRMAVNHQRMASLLSEVLDGATSGTTARARLALVEYEATQREMVKRVKEGL